ncbi:DUF7284 family protein [Natronomonas marina]|uniref:DUF7284 family protein n=1 Tax=Natronomonas marina TaxID=2961939 RepID=UPI0020C94423|nr:hypothetical protein [Natronomonas marina]
MARGVSTVLDVAVCLLLVGTALATLAAAPPTPTPEAPDADAAARTVATATTGVPGGNSTRHTTLAAHLGSAAVHAATVDGQRLVGSSYPAAVVEATGEATGDRVYVTATWEPYPNATVDGRVTAGPKPPASADVAATVMTVESGIDRAPVDDSTTFRTLGGALAEAVVEWLFPSTRTRAALADPRTAPRTVDRYRTVGDALDAPLDSVEADVDVAAANETLTAALADRFETELRGRYATADAAAAETSAGEVTVVVRRWDP